METAPPRRGWLARVVFLRAWFIAGAMGLAACEETGAGGPDVGAFPAGNDAAVVSAPGCGLATEPEPNDTPAEAAPFVAGSAVVGCLASAGDVDIYEIKAPTADLAGGHFAAALTDVGPGTVAVQVMNARDNAPFLRSAFTTAPSTSLFFYWAVAPGETYRVAVSRFSAAPAAFRFTLSARYTKVDDRFEPNDSRAQAKPIALGNPQQAFFFAGHQGEAVDTTAFSDWYSVTLTAGRVTIRVAEVPTTVRPEVELFDASNSSVAGLTMYNNTPGGDIMVSGATTSGLHRLVVRIFAVAPETAGKGEEVPSNFVQPYRLTVSQP